MAIYKGVTVSIILSPEQIAETFWEMDSIEQERFFNHLYEISGLESLDGQMYAVSRVSTSRSRKAMWAIGNYGEE